MENTLLRKFNLTGRKFVCINNKPGLVDDDYMHQHFHFGETYLEALVDGDDVNLIKPDEHVLLILNRDNVPLYVDADAFMLKNETVNELALLPFCAN